MNISLVLSVYNNLELTKNTYRRIRQLYPEVPLIISSDGSNDGTIEWLMSLNDINTRYVHKETKSTFSESYNRGIKLVDTEKLVLIHNDMVIGEHFLENLEKHSTEDILLCYTTIEPPVFGHHSRPGKLIYDFGSNFNDFKYDLFDEYINKNHNNTIICDGGSFFMCGYKKLFEDVGYFDGFSFDPFFCEDDDFLIRTKIKGYQIKTINSAIVYHFVSKTSRFSEELKNSTNQIEINSNRNFVRKWGVPSSILSHIMRLKKENFFDYSKLKIGFNPLNYNIFLYDLEPFFNKIKLETFPEGYINEEQKNTNYNLKEKFEDFDDVYIWVQPTSELTNEDLKIIMDLKLFVINTPPGVYQVNNLMIEIKKDLS